MTTNEIFGAGFAGLTESGRLERAAKELESVVLTQLLSTMRDTVPEGGLLEKSASEDLFRSLLDGEIARSAAEKSPFGLAKAIVTEFEKRIQNAEGASPGTGEDAGSSVLPEVPRGRSWRI